MAQATQNQVNFINRLTSQADQVGELGLKYGQCIMCGRGLKDAFSVKRGIGPVCYKNYGEGIMEEVSNG